MEDVRVKVGSNSLIIDNIIKYCRLETRLNCCLVNSIWRESAQKRLRLCNSNSENNLEQDQEFQALLDKSLNTFSNIGIHNIVQPPLLDCFGSSLKSLNLYNVCFDDVTELSTVLFYAFPNMKELILNDVAVPAKEVHVVSRALDETIPVTKELESLTIEISCYSMYLDANKESGVVELGFNTLFQKFKNIKTLNFNAGSYHPVPDVFEIMLQENVTLRYLEFGGFIEEPDMMEEYLTRDGGNLLHVICDNTSLGKQFQNVSVQGWQSARMDGVNWSTFGNGVFQNLKRLQVVQKYIACFEFLQRMPVLKEIEFVKEGGGCEFQAIAPVNDLARNPPCPSVTSIKFCWGTGPNFRLYYALYFHVFPNVREIDLHRVGRLFLSRLVKRWKNLTKLHLNTVVDADAAYIAEIVTSLKDLDNFKYSSEALTFGDAEGEEFLFHSKLVCLRLAKISMSPIMIRLLQRKLAVFEYLT